MKDESKAPRVLGPEELKRLDRKLSALVVNYNSGAFALRCIESLRAEWTRLELPPSKLEIVLVDNASSIDQGRHLAGIAALGVRVVQNTHNAGYASALNLALTYTSGGANDWVAALNPDLLFLEGSLAPLFSALERDSRVGAVAPRAFIDEDLSLALPPNAMPSPVEHARTELAAVSPQYGRAYARARLERSVAWWTATEPMEAEMLSGACLFLRRGVIHELGALMDARYPLYFEDADLSRELASSGFKQIFEPRATVLHHWSRSAGSGSAFDGDPLTRYHKSRREFAKKHFGPMGRALEGGAQRFAALWPAHKRSRPIHPLTRLSNHALPFGIPFGRKLAYVVEVGLSPTWILAAGAVSEGSAFCFSPRTWAWLFPGRYYVRAFERESLRWIGAWTFMKTSPACSEPESLATAEHRTRPGGAARSA